jgi:PAS domain S-box-containing protein
MASKKLAKLETIGSIDGHLKMILGSAKECIFIKDRSLKYIYVNHAMEELFGRPASELLDLTDLELFGKEATEHMKVLDSRVLAGETIDEDVVKPVNGRMFTFHTIKMPVFDEHGHISGICGMARDITERKISEERSRWNEALLRTMTDNSPLAFYFVDKRTNKILYYNRRFIDIWGLGSLADEIAEGIINNDNLITYCANKVRDSQAFIDSCRLFSGSGTISVVEDELKFTDGRIIRRFSVPVMGDKGNYFGRLYIYEDITEKKRIEESLERVCYDLEDRIQERTATLMKVNAALKEHEARLRESEEKYRSLVENLNDIIWEIDDELRITYVSPKVTDRLGYLPEEIIGQRAGMFITGNPALSFEELFKFGSGQPGLYETPIMHKDGRILLIESVGSPIYDMKERIMGVRGISRDISGRKQVERALNEAKSRAELYVDLMGHDINNMNQVGMGYLEMAMDIVGQDHNIDFMLLKSLEMLNNSSKLIDNVRKLQRVRAGEMKPDPIDLCSVISLVVSEYQFVPNRNIIINFSPDPGKWVMANDLLKDVFSNLIGNSIKHSSGPIWIDIFLSEINVDGIPFYRISVEDNGPGVPDMLKEKIFDRLQRGKTKLGGSGIGLYLVKALVEDYGGSVHVEDRIAGDKSQGTRFIVMLPAYMKK